MADNETKLLLRGRNGYRWATAPTNGVVWLAEGEMVVPPVALGVWAVDAGVDFLDSDAGDPDVSNSAAREGGRTWAPGEFKAASEEAIRKFAARETVTAADHLRRDGEREEFLRTMRSVDAGEILVRDPNEKILAYEPNDEIEAERLHGVVGCRCEFRPDCEPHTRATDGGCEPHRHDDPPGPWPGFVPRVEAKKGDPEHENMVELMVELGRVLGTGLVGEGRDRRLVLTVEPANGPKPHITGKRVWIER